MRYVLLYTTLLLLLALFPLAASVQAQTLHPFLIINESDYPELRQRANQEPWKTMKKEAINYTKGYNSSSNSIDTRSDSMRLAVSRGALAYILDPTNKQVYVNRVYNALNQWGNLLEMMNSGSGWSQHVPPSSAFINSVIAYDIIYNDLTTAQRNTIHARLQAVNNYRGWAHNFARWGALGIWGSFTQGNDYASNYLAEVEKRISPTGVFYEGPGYAWGRLGATWARDAKVFYMDVLTHTGKANYYANPQMIKFYEWLTRGSVTPLGEAIPFGDTWGSEAQVSNEAIYRLSRFSTQAAKNGAWILQQANKTKPSSNLLQYILMDKPLPAPEKPTSSLWDSSASFWERNPASTSLMGALWNPISEDWHNSADVNAIHITAYGEDVMRNSGYAGAGVGIPGFTARYLAFEAKANNTITFNNQNHTIDPSHATYIGKHGLGIKAGFINSSFDFAQGDSGSGQGFPFPQGKRHIRNFMFVHPSSNTKGYFLLLDQTQASGTDTTNSYFHPGGNNNQTITAGRHFRWTVNRRGKNAKIDIFFSKDATTTSISDAGYATGIDENGFTGKALKADFAHGGTVNLQFATILFPHNSSNPVAELAQVSGRDYSGVRINHPQNITDHLIEISTKNPISYQGVTATGKGAWYRASGGNITQFFILEGTQFNSNTSPHNITATQPVTLYLHGSEGSIVSTGSQVTFTNTKTVLLNGQPLDPQSVTGNSVTVVIPSGTHQLELQANTNPTWDLNSSGKVDIFDWSYFVKGFGSGFGISDVVGFIQAFGK